MSMVSGQAPSEDVQEDCSTSDSLINTNAGIDKTGPLGAASPNYGQLYSKGGRQRPARVERVLVPDGGADPVQPVQRGRGDAGRGTPRIWAASRTTCRNPYTAFQTETVPGREDASCGGPGTSANNPTTDPLDLVAPPGGDVASFTGAQSTSSNGTDYIDQYVAKHNPAPLVRVSDRVNADAERPALNEPTRPAQRAGQRGDQLRRQPRRQPGQSRPTGWSHDLQTQHRPRLQLDQPGQLQRRPRRRLQGQQPVRGVQRRRHPQLRDRHPVRLSTRRPSRRSTTPAGCTPPICSSSTTSR